MLPIQELNLWLVSAGIPPINDWLECIVLIVAIFALALAYIQLRKSDEHQENSLSEIRDQTDALKTYISSSNESFQKIIEILATANKMSESVVGKIANERKKSIMPRFAFPTQGRRTDSGYGGNNDGKNFTINLINIGGEAKVLKVEDIEDTKAGMKWSFQITLIVDNGALLSLQGGDKNKKMKFQITMNDKDGNEYIQIVEAPQGAISSYGQNIFPPFDKK